jgi:hypothetical protein
VVVQAVKLKATMASDASKLLRVKDIGNGMWLIILEALFALFILVFIVWWTMYSGGKPAQPRPYVAPPTHAPDAGSETASLESPLPGAPTPAAHDSTGIKPD